MSATPPTESAAELDAVIVGAGLSGLYMLHLLRGIGLRCAVLEAGTDVGGTWYWNRYPGARCDSESMIYSYSFSTALEQEWDWSSRYAPQPEILRYIGHVADRFDLRRDIELGRRVTSAVFDEAAERWCIRTECGERLCAQFCIMATGCISTPKVPDFEGLERFEGTWYHTGHWPHEGVDFTGKRVGVIGTGSSAIQAIPHIAAQATQLTVFQRTPNFSVPAWNAPLDADAKRRWKQRYPEIRQKARESFGGNVYEVNERSALAAGPEEQRREFEARWREGGFSMLVVFSDLLTSPEANHIAAEFVRAKIREKVKDPAVAELLLPRNHPFGTKRLCVDTDYYQTYNRDNVTLVDVRRSPIESITPKGLRVGGRETELDALVFATGFDAMTGALLDIDIRGRDGMTLARKWAQGPRNYLGLSVAGFPNLFTITGPGSPSVLTNMIVSIEQHVEWVAECIAHLRGHDLASIEAELAAEDRWVDHVNQTAEQTLYPEADSWYIGANIPGKPRVFMPYAGSAAGYRKICDRVAADGYRGFVLGRGARPEASSSPWRTSS